uniref:Uncharacterized protein n=1 Tax=Oryza meridionalis TaxID=40149 RepID=A0A0E0DCP2_9ORYZ
MASARHGLERDLGAAVMVRVDLAPSASSLPPPCLFPLDSTRTAMDGDEDGRSATAAQATVDKGCWAETLMEEWPKCFGGCWRQLLVCLANEMRWVGDRDIDFC